ncbi:MAG TPA: sigma-70 family RNA polymerase sigma factor [Gaiellaceae bacterium]|jgi:RNA polymerase sigma-70 factor (ECF subfamily)|nr:sigma-70 family RNA polymerase sigma factor [Gaiellaceae bacterium]
MSKAAGLTDAELVRLCRAGDPDGWNELVERFSRYVYAIAVRGFRLGDEEAEDVFQDVFTRVYTRLDTLRDDSAVRPWIAQLTRRRCLDVLASRGRETAVEEEVLTHEETADLGEVEEAFAVREALAGLSDTCQDILDRFFARDQSYKTIADELEIPPGTIASRIARCLGRLKDALGPET